MNFEQPQQQIPGKKVVLGEKSRTKIFEGITLLADSVISTLGPNGRNVIIQQPPGHLPKSTKDGVSVAKEIFSSDNMIQLGIDFIKQAALKSNQKAGDGTTTATLLAKCLIEEGLKYVGKGVNVVDIKNQIHDAVQEVMDNLEFLSEDVKSDEQLEQIATISSNNDKIIGKLIATAIKKAGMEGVTHIEESLSGDTYLDTVEGMQFDKGFESPYFVTDNNTMSAVMDKPYFLLVNERLNSIADLVPILNFVSTKKRPLVIIAEGFGDEVRATLLVNKQRGTIQVVAVQAPGIGDRRRLILEDIAVLTGGCVVDKNKGLVLGETWNEAWLGESKKCNVTRDTTTIIDGKGTQKDIQARIDEIKNQIEKNTTAFTKQNLQDRLSKLNGGIEIIYVGGNNEIELKEKKDRVDDALNATKAAFMGGIVPGGGMALIRARKGLRTSPNFKSKGYQIVYEACGKPFEQILLNAGYKPREIKKMLKSIPDHALKDGIDVKTGKVANLFKEGIIDPTKVTLIALESAGAVAETVLLTNCLVVNE